MAEFCALMEYVKKFRARFEQNNVFKTGHIRFEELHTVFLAINAEATPEYTMVLQTCDTDGSGVLELDEFVCLCMEFEEKQKFNRYMTAMSPSLGVSGHVVGPEQLQKFLEWICGI